MIRKLINLGALTAIVGAACADAGYLLIAALAVALITTTFDTPFNSLRARIGSSAIAGLFLFSAYKLWSHHWELRGGLPASGALAIYAMPITLLFGFFLALLRLKPLHAYALVTSVLAICLCLVLLFDTERTLAFLLVAATVTLIMQADGHCLSSGQVG